MRNILKPGIALFIIAAVAAAILGYVNEITKEPIAKAEAQATQEAVEAIFPELGSIGEEVAVEEEGNDVTSYIEVKDASDNVIGYAISINTVGFSSGLKLMYGIDVDGNITGLSVVDCSNETPGLGANCVNESFTSQFAGKTGGELAVTKDGGDIDALTGATITSRAVTKAANTASDYFNANLREGGSN